MMRDEQVFCKGCRGRNCIGPFHALKRRWSSLLRRGLFGNVMMVVMMAKNVSFMGSACQRRQNVLVMMMMRMSFEPLGSVAQRRASTVTFFVALGIIIFGLSPLGTRSSFATCFHLIIGLRRRMFQLLSPPQSAIRWR